MAVFGFVSAIAISSCNPNTSTATTPGTIRLDYAYYNPVSLVLKEKGWLEQDLAKNGCDLCLILNSCNPMVERLSRDSLKDF